MQTERLYVPQFSSTQTAISVICRIWSYIHYRCIFTNMIRNANLISLRGNDLRVGFSNILCVPLFLTHFGKRVKFHSICHWCIPVEAFQWDDEFYCSETAQQPGQLLEWREPLDHLKCFQSLDKTLVTQKYTPNKYDFKGLFRTRCSI